MFKVGTSENAGSWLPKKINNFRFPQFDATGQVRKAKLNNRVNTLFRLKPPSKSSGSFETMTEVSQSSNSVRKKSRSDPPSMCMSPCKSIGANIPGTAQLATIVGKTHISGAL
jgi:hypothetical protein